MNKNTFRNNFFFCFDVFLSDCFSMLCEIIDCYINVIFVEIQQKKENLKNAYWVPEFGAQTGIPGSPQTAWIHDC